MQYIGSFTPQASPTGSFNLQYNHGHFLFINESYSNILIKLEQHSFPLQSGQCRMVCVNQSGPLITYQTLSTLQIANAVDAVLVEYYAPGEKYLETYPSNLTRQAIVGNVVQTSGGAMANLINDGNPPATQIIEATPSGDASSAVNINNSGDVILGNATHAGSLTLGGNADISGTFTMHNTAYLAGTNVYGNLAMQTGTTTSLDNGAITTNGSGAITMPNNTPLKMKDTGGTAQDILTVDATNNTRIKSGAASTGGRVYFQSSNSVAYAYIDGNGIHVERGGFNGLSGDQLSRLGSSSGTGNGTFNHTLGATPDFVAITTHVNGSQTVGYYNESSTQITVVTGAGLAWFALLTKRS